MTAHFHPDGTAQFEYCVRCEMTALERLQQFQCLYGIPLFPRLHRDCQIQTKRELADKMSALWKTLEVAGKFPSLAFCIKAATGIDL